MTLLGLERGIASRGNEMNIAIALNIAAARNPIRLAVHALLGSRIVSAGIDSHVSVELDLSFVQLRQRRRAKQLREVGAQRQGIGRLPAQTGMRGRVRAEAAEVGYAHAER